MTLVRVIKDWSFPDLLRQTPDHSGQWRGIQFTLEPVEHCDYVVVLNRVPRATTVHCAPPRLWAMVQEPPVPEYQWLRQGFSHFARIYTPDTTLIGEKYIHSQTALPWWIGKSYDELKRCPPPDKPRLLSWITSNAANRQGHRRRLKFLGRLRKRVEFDLWGKGFTAIEDKWDGLSPYRYALAVENHHTPHYWTEKLADCFLSWAMPIYYGCTNIHDYFPPEAMISIDIDSPDAIDIIEATLRSDRWQRSRDAIAYARELILDRYQFFPFVAQQIQEVEAHSSPAAAETMLLPELPWLYPQPRARILKRTLRAFYARAKRKLLHG